MGTTKARRILSLLLVLAMLLGTLPTMGGAASAFHAAEDGARLETLLTAEQLEAYALIDRSARPSGLIGFEGDYALDDEDGQVSVIVEFVHQPPLIQQAEAAVQGDNIPLLKEATKLAEADHTEFKSGMNRLFGVNSNSRSAITPYEITATYTDAINGVAVKLPAGMVSGLAELDTVWAVYPNILIQADPVEYGTEADGDSIQAGMADTRDFLGIDYIHSALELTGEGITVGVIDTGVDYNHPDLKDAFADSVPEGSDAKLYNGKFYGRNFVVYSELGYNMSERANAFNPMETTYEEWSATGYAEQNSNGGSFYTSHGTHVSGTVAGRGVNEPVSALGMAPDATLVVYRVLGPYGSGSSDWTLSALDKVHEDGCDVVNLSLGASNNDPEFITSIAINNLIVAYDIVFSISAGNRGPYSATLGAPGTSSMAITVAWGTVDSTDLDMTASADTKDAELRLLTNDYTSRAEDNGDGTYTFTYPGLTNSPEDKNTYRLVPIEKVDTGIDTVTVSDGTKDITLGTGTRAEFERMADEVKGNIAVVYRGQAFVTTAAIAKEYGAGAVLVVTNGTGLIYNFQGESPVYAPLFLTKTREAGAELLEDALKNNGGLISLTGCEELTVQGGELSSGSSRGPVGKTLEIKPDIVAPGNTVLSSVPYYVTTPGSRTDWTGEGSYDYSYARMSGTSMAAPHIAGIAALMRQYSDRYDLGWSAHEIKARLMNTADPLNEDNDSYSVHEVGAGYVNPLSAIKAGAYVTVAYDQVLVDDGNGGLSPEKASGEVPSFNFRSLLIDQESEQSVTLDASVFNAGADEKTFNITHVKNHNGFTMSGQGNKIASPDQWNSVGVGLELPESVTAPAGGKGDFSVTVSVPGGTADENSVGIYEGYIVLTNADDPLESYRLPFSLYLRDSELLGLTFVNQPVITTNSVELIASDDGLYLGYDSSVAHVEDSFFADLAITMYQQLDAVYFMVAPGDIDDYTDSSQWLGETGRVVYGSNLDVGRTYFIKQLFYPVYMKYTDAGHANVEWVVYEPGHYKLIAYADTEFGLLLYPMDFYVDNEAPALTLDNLSPDGVVSYSGVSMREAILTGNIYDAGLADMAEKGIKYQMYDSPDDYHGPDPDQALNAIFAKVGNNYIQAGIAPDTGDFTLHLTGLNASGTTDVTLYYYDSFSAAYFTSASSPSYGFDPDNPCLSSYYGLPYAFYGINEGVMTVTLRHEGPFLTIDPDSATVDPGETVGLTPVFNDDAADAGYNSVTWSSSDERVATVDSGGLVTAVDWGAATITATSNNPGGGALRASCEVTVTGINDGVKISRDYVWYGSGEYEDYTVAPREYGSKPAKAGVYKASNGETVLPMMWNVMGEEKQNGIGDRYLTLFSTYAVKTMEYNDDGYVPYGDSRLNGYLNGEFLNVFSGTERNAIPYFDVTVGRYGLNGSLIGEETVTDQRAYVPWGVDANSNSAYANSVFWTAGNEMTYENSLRGAAISKNRMRYRNLSRVLFSTYYLRTPDGAEDKIKAVDGWSNNVVSLEEEDWKFHGEGREWYEQYGNYASFEIGTGVVPVIKLDMGSIVYSYEYISYTDREGSMYGSFSAYDSGLSSLAATNKLAILGGNNGADVGTLSGVPSAPVAIEAGQKLPLFGLASSAYGDEYIIVYKIVGDDADGGRSIVEYGEIATAEGARDAELYTNQLDPGSYKVYVWLQRDNVKHSYEAGTVESFKLTVEPVAVTDVSDGVSLPAGSYVYYGDYRHATQMTDADSNSTVTAREDSATPVLWEVMGEEIDASGRGDGYTTLMSRYVLDGWQYSRNSLISFFFQYVTTYQNSAINIGLNRNFSDSFTHAEYNNIPMLTVDRTDYWVDDYVNAYTKRDSAPNQKVYLPWGTKYKVEDQNDYNSTVRSVFWSAGEDSSISSNTLSWRHDERTDDLAVMRSTLKNGSPASYWLGGAMTDGISYVYSNGKFYQGSMMTVYVNPNRYGGLRPVTKLVPESVVYAAEVREGGEVEPDGVNYLTPGDGENYYKLTVLGGHSGADIGTLTGIPSSAEAGKFNTVTLADVTSSAWGGEYAIAYKIVGDSGNGRTILKHGEFGTSGEAQDLSIDTRGLPAGNYDVYVWLQKNSETHSNEAGVVESFPLSVAGSASLLNVSVSTPTIVSTLAAYLNITVAGAPQGVNLKAYLEVDGELHHETQVTNGAGRMYIPAAPEVAADTVYRLVVTGEGYEGECGVKVVFYDTSIWVATAFEGANGYLNIRFNAPISSKTNFVKAVTVGGAAYSATVDNGNTLVVKDVAYGDLEAGTKLVISGVKYPELFPSYSFTFTIYR